MKFCPNCGAGLADETVFCPACGKPLAEAQPNGATPPYTPYYGGPVYAPPVVDPYDHTAEFDAKDISENKVICMLIYLGGFFGILVALLMSSSSKYVSFHVRQVLKIEVVSILLTIVAAVLSVLTAAAEIFAILLILCAIVMVALVVLRVVSFFQICSGKAKEPVIIRSLGFLK